jgi:hypothetical protein
LVIGLLYIDYIDVYGKICWKPLFYPQPPLLGARLCRGTVQARDRHPQHLKPGTNWQLLILKKIDGKAKSYHSVAYMNQFFISIPVMDGLMFYASILGKLYSTSLTSIKAFLEELLLLTIVPVTFPTNGSKLGGFGYHDLMVWLRVRRGRLKIINDTVLIEIL